MYSRVESRFWQDEKMRAVPYDARHLMLYLLTSPHRNIIGFYFLPTPYACFDLDWDEKQFNKNLYELIKAGVVLYDQETHIVFIKNYLRHNPIANINQAKGAVAKLDELPQTPLFKDLLEVIEQLSDIQDNPYEAILYRLRERIGSPSEAPSKPLRNPSEAPPKPVTVTVTVPVTGTGEGDTCASDDARLCTAGQDPGVSVEADNVTVTPDEQPKKSKPRSPFRSKRQEQLFDQFWAQYPKKKSKGRAEKTWLKLRPDDELFAAIMSGLARAKTSTDWQKDGGQYIPYPASWLNAKGWLDEYQPVRAGPKLSANVEKGLALVEKYRQLEEQERRAAGYGTQ